MSWFPESRPTRSTVRVLAFGVRPLAFGDFCKKFIHPILKSLNRVNPMNPNLRWAIALGLMLFLGVQLFLRPQQPQTAVASGLVMKNQTIRDQDGRVVFQGDVNLAPTLARIERGERDSHRNDGSIHRNLEGKLPRQADRDYYREYVVRTQGLRSVGPQRLVIGKNGETYYTSDHYRTFVRVK